MNAQALSKYTWIGYTAVRSNLAYVGEVMTRTIFMTVVLYIFMRLWTVVYSASGGDRLGGLSMQQMLWYLMITESLTLSSPRVSLEIDEDVRTGRLTVQLLKPLSYCLGRMSQVLGERAIRFAVNVAAGSCVALVLVGPIPFSLSGLVMFAIVLPLAFVIDFLGYFAIGLCAFWLESTAGLTLLYSRLTMLLGGMLMPVELYPQAFQRILHWLPFTSVMYGPSRLFVAGEWQTFTHTILLQGLSCLVFGGLVWLIQRVALARVQSHGG